MNIEQIKNLRIVPKNYECATAFKTVNIFKDTVEIDLYAASKEDFEGYNIGDSVELFGLCSSGLVYFTSVILNKQNNILTIKTPCDYKQIQRRKYTRVPLLGSLKILDIENVQITPIDICAGGLKFNSNTPFKSGIEYKVNIQLVNNLAVQCTIEPIRTKQNQNGCEISAKFKKIRSIDRIALVQYSLRIKSETENKG